MERVGIVVTDLYDYNQQVFINGFNSFCNGKEIVTYVFVGGSADDYENLDGSHSTLFSTLIESNLDTVVIFSATVSSICGVEVLQDFIKRLGKKKIISVGLEIENAYSIVVDNTRGAEDLMNHLIKTHGYRKIGFIKGPENNEEADNRFSAYKSSLEKNGIPVDYKIIAPGSFSPGDGRKGLSLILDVRKEMPDAIFCCHDLAAIEVIKNLKLRGIKVPKEIAVAGFDNIDISRSTSPSLSTVKIPFFDLGLLAGSYIEKLQSGKMVERCLHIDTRIILRESCGCARDRIMQSQGIKNSELMEIIRLANENIIRKSSMDYDIDGYSYFLIECLKQISDSILALERSEDSYDFEKAAENILNRSLELKFNTQIWKNVLEDYIYAVTEYYEKGEKKQFLLVTLHRALIKLYNNEKRILDTIIVDNNEIIQYTNKIGNLLLTCKSDMELKQILKNNLSSLRIKNFFIVLYLKNKGRGELFFSRYSENILSVDAKKEFNLRELLPDGAGESNGISYIVYSIKIDGREIGYTLIESGDSPHVMFSFISEKLSYGFKNISLIKKMDSYTRELEDAVVKRTNELQLANNQLKERSMRDQLTGLYNRRFLEDVIIPKIDTKDVDGYLGLIMVDLDNFKEVNDIWGHSSGDSVIRELAKSLSYTVRPEDYVIRLGGEEFLLVLRNFKGEFFKKVVKNIRKSVKKTVFKMENGDEITKTCSLGAMLFSRFHKSSLDFNTAISIIDKCLYLSKENGRDKGYIIDVLYDQFIGCSDIGNYIVNNFEKCTSTGKVNLFESI